MATVVEEQWDLRSASVDAKGGRRLTRGWWVYDDAGGLMDPVSAVNAVSLSESPNVYIGTPHPSWAPALLTKFDPQPNSEDPSLYTVRADYEEPKPQPGFVYGSDPSSPPPPPGSPGRQSGSPPTPESRQAGIYSVSFRREPVYALQDADGLPLVNAAKQLLTNVPPMFETIGVLKYRKFTTAVNFATWFGNLDKCNLNTWNGFSADSLRVTGLEVSFQTENGFPFIQLDYVIEYKASKWIPTRILNIGKMFLIPATPASAGPPPVPAVPDKWVWTAPDKYGRGTISRDVMLRPDGTGESATANSISFRFFDRVDYATNL